MGACEFTCLGKGKTAQKAFNILVEEAQYDYGHAGYTGTIAEKDSFVMIDVPADCKTPIVYADKLLADDDKRISDKWGPAGCVQVSKNTWYFFGWASS